MIEDLTHILIFKTNISTFSDKLRVQQLFAGYPAIEEWNLDAEDIDCVLRVVSHVLSAREVIQMLQDTGFQCQELE